MRVTAKIIPAPCSGPRTGGFAFADDVNGERYFIHIKEFRGPVKDSVLTGGTVLEFDAAQDHANRPYAQDIVIVSAPSEDEVLFERLCLGDLRDEKNIGSHRNPRWKKPKKKAVK